MKQTKAALATAVALSLTACGWAHRRAEAHRLATTAYTRIDERRFEPGIVGVAVRDLATARMMNPDEPWVLLAESLATQVQGYRSGDWYEPHHFEPGTLDAAYQKAQDAIRLDPKLAPALFHAARLCVARRDFKEVSTGTQMLDS